MSKSFVPFCEVLLVRPIIDVEVTLPHTIYVPTREVVDLPGFLDILGDLPSILSLAPWLKNRREDIIITRILTRMIITLALLHRFGLHNKPLLLRLKSRKHY
ncbi:hypothetical protein AVEN_215646-1 [Araneus ventricosus]|uniref:Uncharacterized protein n=1 Tax=Araneus ventricosus TaxID=182803 RepID=A0A4Y2X6D9_ARAVE|nr:hypothetical protein AVEN_215646-1 [Araneus ventricosus]